LLILDFWSVTCTACITYFPEIDSLQEKFKDRLQFILVTDNTAQRVATFLSKFKRIKLPLVPLVTDDTILSKWFYHVTIPHHVWIDSNRVVRAITSGYNTTSVTIQTFLEGKDPGLFVKKEIKGAKLPVPGLGSGQDKIPYYSYIINNIQGIRGGGVGYLIDSLTHKRVGLKIDATPVVELCKIAFGKNLSAGPFRYDNRVVYDGKHRDRYFMPQDETKYDAWADTNTFYYFLKLPSAREDEIFDFMQQDVQRFFKLRAAVEKREIKCLALVRISSDEKFKSSLSQPISVYDEEGTLQLKNSTMGDLAAALSFALRDLPAPVIDETGYLKPIDISLVTKPANLELVRKQLNAFGLDLIEKTSSTDVLVIHDW
jgi:thiol-disulfide isomerase/thioredoxin